MLAAGTPEQIQDKGSLSLENSHLFKDGNTRSAPAEVNHVQGAVHRCMQDTVVAKC